jgi:hypothetical protein
MFVKKNPFQNILDYKLLSRFGRLVRHRCLDSGDCGLTARISRLPEENATTEIGLGANRVDLRVGAELELGGSK